MKLTASSLFSAIASGAARFVQTKVYVRKVTVLTDSLSGGGAWTDVTSRIEPFGSVVLGTELSVGQFETNSLVLKGRGITWWKANVFNASASEYIEVKIETQLGLSELRLASDVVGMCNAFVGKKKTDVTFNESDDSVGFSIYSPDDIADVIPASTISTQYKNLDVDGGGTDGIVLRKLPGLYVTNANVTSYVLQLGVHQINYDYNGGTERANLDGGAWVTLGVGSNTLGNASASADDTQRVVLYLAAFSNLPLFLVTEEIVVITAGTTLPNVWWHDVTARFLAQKIYEKLGIASGSLTNGTLEYTTWDSGKALQLMDAPPEQPTNAELYDSLRASVVVGSTLYVAVNHQIFKRDMTTGVYTLCNSLADTTAKASRLLYNARNNHIWVVYGKSGAVNGYVRVLLTTDDSWASSEVTLSTVANDMRAYSCCLIDYNYTGASYKYAFVYTHSGGSQDIREVNSSFTDAQVFAAATLGAGVTIISEFVYQRPSANLNEIYVKVLDTAVRKFWIIGVNAGSGTWFQSGVSLSGVPQYNVACIDESDTRIYFRSAAVEKVQSHTHSSATLTDHVDLVAGDTVECMMWHAGQDLVYFTRKIGAGGDHQLISISGTSTGVLQATGVYAKDFGSFEYNNRLYLMNTVTSSWVPIGYLVQFANVYSFVIQRARFEDGDSVKVALKKFLNSFNLTGTLSPTKAARFQRRGNDSGTIETSGNSFTITNANATGLVESLNVFQAADAVRVIAGTTEMMYDGSSYDAQPQFDSYVVTIQSDFIDPRFVKTMVYRAYQFFKTKHNVYRIPLNVALIQYEPLDGVSVSLAGQKISVNSSGLLYNCEYNQDGSITPGVLL